MHLERVELTDFRNYATARLALGPGPRVLIGANAQGKTNLLEAIHYLSVGVSHRVSSDGPLVRTGAEAAVIRAVVRLDAGRVSAAGAGTPAGAAADAGPVAAGAGSTATRSAAAHATDDSAAGCGAATLGAARTVPPAVMEGRALTVELELRPAGRNRARLNGQPQPRPRDVIGQVRSVLFAPEDLALVKGDPADRRRFLDELLSQRRRAYLAGRQEYERILRQRNTLLRAGRAVGRLDATLPTWTEALVAAAAPLLAARIAVVHALVGPADDAYRDLVAESPQREAGGRLGLTYELSTGRRVAADRGAGIPDPAALAAELREGLAAVARAEQERGMTLAGPHRDEVVFSLNGLPAKGYASHGETWSLALALRLASREILHDVGEEPVVLLDDVFAELDERRRARLAARCEGFEQVLVTAAVDADVPLGGPRHLVRAGSVTTGPSGARDVEGAGG